MPKQAISVTLEADNLAWVRGRAMAAGRISVSDMLDKLIAGARAGRAGSPAGARSVVGRISIAPPDVDLGTADDAVRAVLARSLSRPVPSPTRPPAARRARARRDGPGA